MDFRLGSAIWRLVFLTVSFSVFADLTVIFFGKTNRRTVRKKNYGVLYTIGLIKGSFFAQMGNYLFFRCGGQK